MEQLRFSKAIFAILSAVVALCIPVVGCRNLSPAPSFDASKQFEVTVAGVYYDASLPYLRVLVDVYAKDTFTGEPFNVVKLAGRTIEQSTPPVWLAVLSVDGHYFGSVGPVTWTKQELRIVGEAERDIRVIQAAERGRTKRLSVECIPITDKGVAYMYSELGTYGVKDVQVTGVVGKFNKFFDLVLVAKEQMLELRKGDSR